MTTTHYEVWYWNGEPKLPDGDTVVDCGPTYTPHPHVTDLADAIDLLRAARDTDIYRFQYRIARAGREIIDQKELDRE